MSRRMHLMPIGTNPLRWNAANTSWTDVSTTPLHLQTHGSTRNTQSNESTIQSSGRNNVGRSRKSGLCPIPHVPSVFRHEKIHHGIILPQSAHKAVRSFAHRTFAIRRHDKEIWVHGQMTRIPVVPPRFEKSFRRQNGREGSRLAVFDAPQADSVRCAE